MTGEDGSSVPETIVKEAVGIGLDSSMRESILDAVDEAEGRRSSGVLPLAGGAMAIGAGLGYLLGSQEMQTPQVEDDAVSVEIPPDESVTPDEDGSTGADGGGSGLLPKLLAAVAIAGAVAYLRRRRSGDEEGWEPIEEIDSAVDEVGSDVADAVTDEADTDAEGETETNGSDVDAANGEDTDSDADASDRDAAADEDAEAMGDESEE